MIAATRKWFKRNRANLAIGAGLVGVGYLAGQYIVGKVNETRQRLRDDRVAKENLRRRFEQNQLDCTYTVLALLPTAKDNIFEALPVERITEELQKLRAERLARNGADVESLDSPSKPPSIIAAEDDGKSLKSSQSESFVHASQITDNTANIGGAAPQNSSNDTQSPRKTKSELWNEMKISSITRAITLVYTLGLLNLLTRIQLNLLGRRSYLSSVVALATPSQDQSRITLENRDDDNIDQNYGNDFETNRRYLTFGWWLLHRGCMEIMKKVTVIVENVFEVVNPRDEITLERLSELMLEVRKRVEGATEEQRRLTEWLPYLLPPPDREAEVLRESGMPDPEDPSESPISVSLRRLLDETSDLIESPAFSHVLTLTLDSAFSLLVDSKLASQAFKVPPISNTSQRLQEIVDITAKSKVASVLAIFCRQAHSIGYGGPALDGVPLSEGAPGGGNEYLAALEAVRDLDAFAAVVYSSNLELRAPETGLFEPVPDVERKNDSHPAPAPQTIKTREVRNSSDKDTSEEAIGGDVSLIEAEQGFETAWGKAVSKKELGTPS